MNSIPHKKYNIHKIFSQKSVYFAILAAILVVIDQYTKRTILNTYPHTFFVTSIESGPYAVRLHSALSINKGISWGLCAQWHIHPFAFTALSGAALYFLGRILPKISRLGYTLIIAGAVGNMIDRWSHTAGVIDFIRLTFEYPKGFWSFPTFNGADIFITIGAILLIIQDFNRHKR